MPYSLAVAQTRFYSWAACRAAMAGSAKAKRKELQGALSHCGVIQFIQEGRVQNLTSEQFDELFYDWVERAQYFLRKQHGKRLPFGIAAKLVSVYLKGAWVLHSPLTCAFSKEIHPPIDGILLKAIDVANGTSLSKQYKWQKLDRTSYEYLIASLRNITGNEPLWRIEEHWKP